jgi:hypothetical protein|nr:MAG: hypothetical protein [Bacteriophage sp.]DAJ13916.1 MAG TPA: hypothetical protein [Myoviridae sp. ctfA14]DAW22174.1 MAG TPA: hypothetical protein [Bacteriophage sp.]DAY73090.1 MAG TPA: hypothetical protein [Caudoviricetes sp.]
MAQSQLTRFECIYANRDEALKALSCASRQYAELVAVRYYNEVEDVCILLVIFKSADLGDFDIVSDTMELSQGPRIFTAKKQSEEQSDQECILIALFGEKPKNGDVVILTSYDGTTSITYTMIGGQWIKTGGTTADGLGIIFEDSNTIDFTMSPGPTESKKTLTADVKLDNNNLIYDEKVDGIRINKIYGGTF